MFYKNNSLFEGSASNPPDANTDDPQLLNHEWDNHILTDDEDSVNDDHLTIINTVLG